MSVTSKHYKITLFEGSRIIKSHYFCGLMRKDGRVSLVPLNNTVLPVFPWRIDGGCPHPDSNYPFTSVFVLISETHIIQVLKTYIIIKRISKR